jgi:zinc transporter ZupT
MTDRQPSPPRRNTMVGVWTALSIGIGAALGVALHNIGVGVALGLIFGVFVGLGLDRAGSRR